MVITKYIEASWKYHCWRAICALGFGFFLKLRAPFQDLGRGQFVFLLCKVNGRCLVHLEGSQMLKMKLVECPIVSTYKAVFDNIVMGEYVLDLDKAV